MKLTIHEARGGEALVTCPRIEKPVDARRICKHCSWLSIINDGIVRCRWTQEKEDLKTGKRFYEAG